MKRTGLAFLVGGFLWIAWDAVAGFTTYSYTQWMYKSKTLPPGETIGRSEAISAMRELSLDLKTRRGRILAPAVLMLVGGLVGHSASLRKKVNLSGNSSGPNH